MKLSAVIDELVEEKGLDRDLVGSIICEGMRAAHEKKYPGLLFDISYNSKTDDLVVRVQKQVISGTQVTDSEISLRKARFVNRDLNVGDLIWLPSDKPIGRIEILRAKQVIANKINEIEAATIYDKFKEKENTIVYGVVHKCERSGTTVKVQDCLAFLPRSLSIPDSECIVGYSIRALLKEVLEEPRNENQLILDRASDEFLHQLLKLEIPEIYEKIVEIKKIVRFSGYKSKVAVISNEPNIDPVGTCVGVGGSRIRPILKELGDREKIDIIPWSENIESLVRDALKPAKINKVKLVEDGAGVNVWLDEDQRSLAIGKMGRNIMLASKLCGLDIDLMQSPGKKNEIDITNAVSHTSDRPID